MNTKFHELSFAMNLTHKDAIFRDESPDNCYKPRW